MTWHNPWDNAIFIEMRRNKPLEELRRKAVKAERRQRIWTVEEVDFAKECGRAYAQFFAERLKTIGNTHELEMTRL